MIEMMLGFFLSESPIDSLRVEHPVEVYAYEMPVVKSELLVKPKQVACMAKAIYFETKGLYSEEQISVGYLVLNRSIKRGLDYCKVINQRHEGRCEFPWSCEKRKVTDEEEYAKAYGVALAVIERLVPNPIGDSEFMTTKRKKDYKVRTKHHTFY